MSPAFTTRRHADAFDRLVEAARRGAPASASGRVPTELAELATFASSLRDVPAVAPRPAFSADLRERLMAAAATELTPAEAATTERLTVRTNPTVRRRRERRLTVGIAALAIVGASAGTALASQGALPGEPLYPVKRAIENVRTGFTAGEQGKGTALLSDADTRLSEVGKLSHGSTGDDARIAQTLNAFAEQAKKASDLLLTNYQQNDDAASIAKLQTFTASSIDQLTVLEPLLPDSAKQALTSAAQAVMMIDTAAHNACPSCGGSPITSLPETLLNPVANTLDALTGSLVKKPAAPATTDSKPAIKLPTVPVDVGPANVAPSAKPSTGPSTKTAKTTKPTKVTSLVPKPSAPPTSLGQAVQGTVDTVTGTVDGVLDGVTGTLDGVVGGLLGTDKSQAP